jgi:hypothetical protein
MPSLFNLTGLVEKEKHHCFAHRVNADIWEGRYRGMLVSAIQLGFAHRPF